MRWWRIVKTKHAAVAFDGEGARRFEGRWNSKGTPVVYCSATLSLAALELLVHLEVEDFGVSRVAIPVEGPDFLKIERLSIEQLSSNWRDYPAPLSLAILGDRWVAQAGSSVLEVPSAVIPQESNLLLNPQHPDFQHLHIGQPEPFGLDARLLLSEGNSA